MIHSKKAISGFLLISGIFLGACKSEQVSNIPTVTQPSANTPIKLEFEKTSVTKFSTASKSAKLEITIDYVQAKGEHPAAKKNQPNDFGYAQKTGFRICNERKKPDLANLSLDSCLALAQKKSQNAHRRNGRIGF